MLIEVFTREYASGLYGVPAYVLARTSVDIPLVLLQTGIQMVATFWFIGFQGNFFLWWSVLFLLGFVSNSMGMALGAFSSDIKVRIKTRICFVIVFNFLLTIR